MGEGGLVGTLRLLCGYFNNSIGDCVVGVVFVIYGELVEADFKQMVALLAERV